MKLLTVLVVALVVSLGANAYLLVTRDGVREPSPPPRPASRGVPSRQPTLVERVKETEADVTSSYTELSRDVLEKRLATAEKRLHALLPPNERFEISEPAPEHEAEIRPFLDKVFKVKPGEAAPYEIECRGMTCRLSAPPDRHEWMQPLQTDPDGFGLFAGMMFGPDDAYLSLAELEQDPAKKLALVVAKRLYGNPSLEECRTRHSPPENVGLIGSVRLGGARRLELHLDGTLAEAPVGLCARRVIEDVLATIAVPPDVVTFEPLGVPIVVPDR